MTHGEGREDGAGLRGSMHRARECLPTPKPLRCPFIMASTAMGRTLASGQGCESLLLNVAGCDTQPTDIASPPCCPPPTSPHTQRRARDRLVAIQNAILPHDDQHHHAIPNFDHAPGTPQTLISWLPGSTCMDV
jgi:hypothetical protein